MRILITGASGFIGRELACSLARSGHSVRATYRREPGVETPGVDWVQVPEIESAAWPPLLDDCDYVVHLAALAHQINKHARPEDFQRVNTHATTRLAESVAQSSTVRRLLFISSIGAVCSQSAEIVTHRTVCQPDSDYGKSKRAAELALAKVLAHTKADWCVLRPTLVYGPRNPGNMLRLMRLIQTGLPLPLAGVRNRRSFIYVGNVVDAIVQCLGHPEASRQAFNIADSEVLSTPDLIARIAQVSGGAPRLWSVPEWTLRLAGRAGDVAAKVARRSLGIDSYSMDRLLGSLQVDASFVRGTVGWNPPFSTEEGLRRTFAASALA